MIQNRPDSLFPFRRQNSPRRKRGYGTQRLRPPESIRGIGRQKRLNCNTLPDRYKLPLYKV